MKKLLAFMIILFASFSSLACARLTLTTKTTTQNNTDQLVDENVGAFSSYQELSEYLEQFYQKTGSMYYNSRNVDMLAPGSPALESTNDGVSFGDGDKRDHSKTNNQVDGVEESDTIITDGFFIYIVSGDRFFIVDAESLEIVFDYQESSIWFSGLYVYEDKVVVLGSYYTYSIYQDPGLKDEFDGDDDTSVSTEVYRPGYWFYNYQYGSKVIIFDTSDMDNIEVFRELDFESTYIANTRMINGYLYLVMNNYSISYYFEENDFVPRYKDSSISDEFVQLPANRIYYMPNDGESFNYLLLASVKVDTQEEVKIRAYLGSAYQIFMSLNNLYVTVYRYSFDQATQRYDNKTYIIRFEIMSNELVYQAYGVVKGSPLNQFSMDEYDGVFRIAVTDYDYDGNQTIITNTLYLLDAQSDLRMEEISQLTGLGKPGERIYAVRFTEDIAYVVTFVNTDPLYKIDLSDVENPAILGEHYEDGVSDYLHMITDTLMVGVGRQAETNEGGWTFFTGVKIALYDTSGDTPINLDTYFVEGQYSYSRVTYDHKAFVYFTPEGEDFTYIVIPVSIYYQDYSRYSTQMLVFKVHHSGELELVAQIEHMDTQRTYYDTIEKAVIIENYIYTMSYSQIQVFDMNQDFNFVDSLVFYQYYYVDYPTEESPIGTVRTD